MPPPGGGGSPNFHSLQGLAEFFVISRFSRTQQPLACLLSSGETQRDKEETRRGVANTREGWGVRDRREHALPVRARVVVVWLRPAVRESERAREGGAGVRLWWLTLVPGLLCCCCGGGVAHTREWCRGSARNSSCGSGPGGGGVAQTGAMVVWLTLGLGWGVAEFRGSTGTSLLCAGETRNGQETWRGMANARGGGSGDLSSSSYKSMRLKYEPSSGDRREQAVRLGDPLNRVPVVRCQQEARRGLSLSRSLSLTLSRSLPPSLSHTLSLSLNSSLSLRGPSLSSSISLSLFISPWLSLPPTPPFLPCKQGGNETGSTRCSRPGRGNLHPELLNHAP